MHISYPPQPVVSIPLLHANPTSLHQVHFKTLKYVRYLMYNHKNLRCRLNSGRMEPGSSKQVLVWVIRAENAMSWRNMGGLLTIHSLVLSKCIYIWSGAGVNLEERNQLTYRNKFKCLSIIKGILE